MSYLEYYMNNNRLNIHNIYKYLVNLHKINVIPYFEVSFNDTKDEITFTFNYNNEFDRCGTSKIIYNIYTKIWTSQFNTTSFENIYKNYKYLIENKMLSIDIIDTQLIINLESKKIDDILEPSLNPFNTNLEINVYNMHNIDNVEMHNLYYSEYYLFMNNVIQLDGYHKIKSSTTNLPTTLQDNIIDNYAILNNFSYNNFMELYIKN
jgi:hypothetical protein